MSQLPSSTALPKDTLTTRIWQEEPMPDNPYAVARAHCHGYDVYGEMVGQARWADMLFLLFAGEAPDGRQSRLLDALAVGLANPGPRDPSVHAAMCGGIAGSAAAASLMAALASGAGNYGGAREVWAAMRLWQECMAGGGGHCWWACWQATQAAETEISVWPELEHPPGFDPHGSSRSAAVDAFLHRLLACGGGACLGMLAEHGGLLERTAGLPLSISGVAAAALTDLGFGADQGEMLFLLLRLPGAAAHALEQSHNRYNEFPFGPVSLQSTAEVVNNPSGAKV